MNRIVHVSVLLLACSWPRFTRADRGELYVSLSGGPTLVRIHDPLGTGALTSALAFGADAQVYYGLTNTIHFGADLRLTLAKNVTFSNVTGPKGGNIPTTMVGTLYEDPLSFGLAGFVSYRVDTGYVVAPVFRAELGATRRSYNNIQLVDDLRGFGIQSEYPSETALTAGGSLSLEYRFLDYFLSSLSAHARRDLTNSLATWEFFFPLEFAFIW